RRAAPAYASKSYPRVDPADQMIARTVRVRIETATVGSIRAASLGRSVAVTGAGRLRTSLTDATAPTRGEPRRLGCGSHRGGHLRTIDRWSRRPRGAIGRGPGCAISYHRDHGRVQAGTRSRGS